VSGNGIMRQKAESINDVWCWDFIHDRDERGRVLRWLVIEDEFTREGLSVEVRRSFKASDVLNVLSELHPRGRARGPLAVAGSAEPRAWLSVVGRGFIKLRRP